MVANGSVKVSVVDGTIAMSDGEVGVGIVADGNTRVSVADGTITLSDGEVGVRVVANGSVKVSVVDGTITLSDDEVGLGSREVCDRGGGNITLDDVTGAGGWDVTGGGADGATCDGEINVAVVNGLSSKLSPAEVGVAKAEVCDVTGGLIIMDDAMSGGDVANKTFEVVGASSDDDISSKIK